MIAFVLPISGCVKQPPPKSPTGAEAKAKQVHDHPDEGPHGGALAEWGDEKYHAEFTVNHAKKQATVYILDGSVKKASPIAAETITLSLTNVKPPLQVTLKAEPQEGDPKGQASRFVGTHDALGKEMDFEGEISGKVGETPYSGTFKEKAEHEHKHDKKK
jgi:hypothetical protein